jgi:hypothetical protein
MGSTVYAVRQVALLERAVVAAGSAPAGVPADSHLREVTAPTFACGQGTRMPFAGSVWGRLRSERNAAAPAIAATTKQDVFQGHRAWGPPM